MEVLRGGMGFIPIPNPQAQYCATGGGFSIKYQISNSFFFGEIFRDFSAHFRRFREGYLITNRLTPGSVIRDTIPWAFSQGSQSMISKSAWCAFGALLVRVWCAFVAYRTFTSAAGIIPGIRNNRRRFCAE